jgi:hypothetical protein
MTAILNWAHVMKAVRVGLLVAGAGAMIFMAFTRHHRHVNAVPPLAPAPVEIKPAERHYESERRRHIELRQHHHQRYRHRASRASGAVYRLCYENGVCYVQRCYSNGCVWSWF